MISRPLGQMERCVWSMDLGAPLNFTTVVRVKGPLDEEVVQAALHALAARHVHLRSRIAQEGSEVYFRTDAVRSLGLEVLPPSSEADLVPALEREINTPVPGSGPLARFVYAPSTSSGESHLLLTLHHAIGDGMSGAFLARDLVSAAAQHAAGARPVLAALEDPGPLDAAIPPDGRGLAVVPAQLRLGLREAWYLLRHGRVLRVRRERECSAHARRARVIPVTLAAATVDRLTAKARAERTTVHGALSAALLLAVVADARVEKGAVMFGSPVNVRKRLDPPVGEQLGFYVSMSIFRGAIRPQQELWDVARDVRRQIEGDLSRDGGLAMLGMVLLFYRLLGGASISPRTLVERWEKHAPATSGLTNLGRLPIETRHGPFTIEDCHFAASPSGMGELLSTATSLHGRTRWNFIWPDPTLDEAHARAIVSDAVVRLHAALGEPALRVERLRTASGQG